MQNEPFETPRRPKQLNDNLSDRLNKLSTIESQLSRDSQTSKGIYPP